MILKFFYYSRLLIKHLKHYRVAFLLMVALYFIGSLLESLGIFLFLPVLSMSIDPDSALGGSFLLDALRYCFDHLHIDMTVINMALVMTVLFIFKAIFLYCGELYNFIFPNSYQVDTVNEIFSKFLHTTWRYSVEQKRGYLIDYILTVSERNKQLLLSLGQSLSALLTIILYLLFSMIISPAMTLTAIVFMVIPLAMYTKILSNIMQFGKNALKAGNNLSKLVEQYFSGNKIIRAYNVSSNAIENVTTAAQSRMNNLVKAGQLRIAYRIGLEFIVSCFLLCIIVLYIYVFSYPLSEMLVIIMFLARTFQKISAVQKISNVAINIPGIQLIEKVSQELYAHRDSSPPADDSSLQLQQEIIFNNIFFSYDTPSTDKSNYILENISFAIPKGSMCGIVGGSGTGKTTLIDLIMGFLQPTTGDILIDGRPLSQLNIFQWKSLIGYVPQEGLLLNESIQNNILFYREITETAVIESANLANCLEFIEKTEHGLQTLVGDNGIRLSGGQRQRICLARALAGKPQILILDEATSALDSQAESIIREAIEKLHHEVTLIVVSHRISTVMKADQIIVLDKGKIAELGSPEELLHKNGLFKRMYEKQSNNR